MNGPEHYREAERVTRAALSDVEAHAEGFSGWSRGELIALAQMHAALALAAATAYPAVKDYTGDEDGSVSRGWTGVA